MSPILLQLDQYCMYLQLNLDPLHYLLFGFFLTKKKIIIADYNMSRAI